MAAQERSLTARAPARQAARKASTKFEAQIMSSPVKADEKSPVKAPTRARSRPNLKQIPSSSRRSATAPRPGVKPRPGSRKRPISLDSRKSDDEESDLTSLTAGSPSPKSKALSAPGKIEVADNDLRNLNYLWVLLDFNGEVYGFENEDDGVERIWWPAVFVASSKKTEYRVRLFGEIGALKSNSIVNVANPHSGNIIAYCNPSDEIRFTTPQYVVSSPGKDTQSPKKRQKLDRSGVETRWYDALSASVGDVQENEVPSMVFLNSVEGIPTRDRPSVRAGSGSVKGKGKGKGRAKAPADDELSDLDSDARWSPPPPDSSLSIPGELILAREKKNSTVHWPAKLLGYLPPETRKGTAHYHVQWMDNTVTKPGTEIERDMFYVYEDDGFGTCKLGPFESVFQEVVNDDDADDDTDKPGGARRRRSPSPEPCDPPPPSGDAFADLGLHEQFVYTKPVLQAILRDEYPPARAVHTQFIGGGQGRNAVAKEAGERGQMDPRDVEQFHKYLTEWVMRPPDMGMGGRGNDDADAKQLGGGADEEEIGAEAPKADDIAGAEGNTETPEIAETSLKDVDIPPTTNETLPVPSEEQMRDLEANEDPALHETLCAPASPTATVLDDGASSPPLPPPSSSFSISADNDVLMEEEPEEEADAPRAVVPADVSDDDIERAFDTSSTLSEASDVSDLVPRAKPPRQVGCDAYEGLSTVEKMDYCLNVLLPELLIQIFLWRTGKRTAVALQSEEEEKRLHVLGEEEKRRTDWVFDIKRMRAQKEREINKTVKVVGGTASRPKKVFAR